MPLPVRSDKRRGFHTGGGDTGAENENAVTCAWLDRVKMGLILSGHVGIPTCTRTSARTCTHTQWHRRIRSAGDRPVARIAQSSSAVTGASVALATGQWHGLHNRVLL